MRSGIRFEDIAAKDKENFDDRADARTIVSQIGRMNLFAISGGRVIDSGHGVILPVGSGYKVTVDLAWNDTYTVRRIRIVGVQAWLYGEVTGVHAEELGEVAYQAHAFRSYDFGTLPETQAA